jgi:hypothetical protein
VLSGLEGEGDGVTAEDSFPGDFGTIHHSLPVPNSTAHITFQIKPALSSLVIHQQHLHRTLGATHQNSEGTRKLLLLVLKDYVTLNFC